MQWKKKKVNVARVACSVDAYQKNWSEEPTKPFQSSLKGSRIWKRVLKKSSLMLKKKETINSNGRLQDSLKFLAKSHACRLSNKLTFKKSNIPVQKLKSVSLNVHQLLGYDLQVNMTLQFFFSKETCSVVFLLLNNTGIQCWKKRTSCFQKTIICKKKISNKITQKHLKSFFFVVLKKMCYI